MEISPQSSEEREILIRTIDVLSMEVLRLKSENDILQATAQGVNRKTHQRVSILRPNKSANVWSKAVNYYHREGFRNTVSKILSKLSGQ